MRVARVVVDIPGEGDRPAFRLPDTGDGGGRRGGVVRARRLREPSGGRLRRRRWAPTATSPNSSRFRPFSADRSSERARARCREWIASEYACPLSAALRLFTPPGGTPKAVRHEGEDGSVWSLRRAGVGPVDDRWAEITEEGRGHVPRKTATAQRAVLDALKAGPVRVAELTADLGAVSGALKALEGAGAVCRDAAAPSARGARPRAVGAASLPADRRSRGGAAGDRRGE